MGRELTETERIAVVETKVDNVEKKVDGVANNVDGLHSKFDAFMELFMTNKVADAKFETVNTRIGSVESDVNEIKQEMSTKRHNYPVWIAAITAIASVSVAVWAVLSR